MNKQELQAYWNLSRVIKTIPEEAFQKDPQAIQLGRTYYTLEQMFFKYMQECNSHKEEEEKQEDGQV